MPEILDIVDENDNVIGTYPRAEIYERGLKYVRVVEAFIRNSSGELWIPIRREDKLIAPSGFDIGAAGHVEHGESYEEALRKEVMEEIGWDIDQLSIKPLGKYGPQYGLASVSQVYEIQTDETPPLNSDDFTSAEWLQPQELADRINAGHPAKSNLIALLRAIYDVK